MNIKQRANSRRRKQVSWWWRSGGYLDLPAVDLAKFLWFLGVYKSAADLRMPSLNPACGTIEIEDQAFSFTDNPLNRGMIAVTQEAEQMNIDAEPYMHRFMGQVDLLRWKSVWAVGACRKGEDGTVQVTESFIYALARARYRGGYLRGGFDQGDVMHCIRLFLEGKLSESTYTLFSSSKL